MSSLAKISAALTGAALEVKKYWGAGAAAASPVTLTGIKATDTVLFAYAINATTGQHEDDLSGEITLAADQATFSTTNTTGKQVIVEVIRIQK